MQESVDVATSGNGVFDRALDLDDVFGVNDAHLMVAAPPGDPTGRPLMRLRSRYELLKMLECHAQVTIQR